MNEIIERVAKAIWSADPEAGHSWEFVGERRRAGYFGQARAAIPAMRKPTEAMLNAGINERLNGKPAVHIWRAMIDAALAE